MTAASPILSLDDLDVLAAAYTVLSRLLLAPPGDEALDRLRDPELLAAWPIPASEPTDAGRELLLRSRYLGEDAGAIRRDYNRLFVGPDQLLAPPWESVHRSLERLVFEEQTFAVRAFYARFGLVAPRLDREPDDHIGLELQLLATLSLRALDAAEAGDDTGLAALVAAHEEFLTDHLLAWAPTLMALVHDHATTHFYRGVGALGQGLVGHAAMCLSIGRQP